MIRIKKGLNIPISGELSDTEPQELRSAQVGILGKDYLGMRPTMLVEVGDLVKVGSPLFSDKKNPGVVYRASASGKVCAINRGAKRALLSVVIEQDDKAQQVDLPSLAKADPEAMDGAQLANLLQESGLWTALRTRPFNKVPAIDSKPYAIFVSVIDTEPLAIDPELIVRKNPEAFALGLKLLTKLTEGNVHLCHAKDFTKDAAYEHERIKTHVFGGKHPAGLVGTHMHFIAPVSRQRVNWHIAYQDVIALGTLAATGKIDSKRYVSLAGPMVQKPQLLLTDQGADIQEICQGRLLADSKVRIISGSILSGAKVERHTNYIGRFHNKISAIKEDRERVFIRYLSPGVNSFSTLPIYLSYWFGGKRKFDLGSSTMGSERAMVPIGVYEKIMPLDILPTQLLRSLIVEDIETAVSLGCLELAPEDLSLCTFACPGKYEYGEILQRNLDLIEKEM